MYHYVYQITNLLNNMIYVGKRSSKKHPDIDPYFGSGVHLKRAIKKYGKENFKKEIISIVDTAEAAEELEEKIVNIEFIARKDTYNMIIGGGKGIRGMKHTDESKAKMTGRRGPLSEEQRKMISDIHKGKNLSNEHKVKISEGNKGKKLKEYTKQKISDANKGNRRSQETKDKISASMKGKKFSDEHRAKLSKAKKGNNKNTAKTVWINDGNISKRVKPDVINVYILSGFTLGRI